MLWLIKEIIAVFALNRYLTVWIVKKNNSSPSLLHVHCVVLLFMSRIINVRPAARSSLTAKTAFKLELILRLARPVLTTFISLIASVRPAAKSLPTVILVFNLELK